MLVLHTSDLHLGRKLNEENLFDNQEYMLKQIIKIIKDRKVDAVLIAGDIYDRHDPSVEAYNLFNNFLNELNETGVQTYIISGNHDSIDKLNFGSKLFDKLNVHIASQYDGHLKKYSQDDTDIYLMPFVRRIHIKDYAGKDYEQIKSSNDIVKWLLGRETIDKKRNNILLMHQFVVDKNNKPDLSSSESGNYVGTLDEVNASLLDDFDYVALGHIHRPQHIKRDTIRYSGSPLKYSFDEEKNVNSVVLYDTDNKTIEKVELKPLRDVIVYQGKLEDILKLPDNINDYIRVDLLDEDPIPNARIELERKFKYLIYWQYLKHKSKTKTFSGKQMSSIENKSCEELFDDFFEFQMGKPLDENEKKQLKNIIDKLEEDA